jgi:hypothetical protein
VTRTDHRDANKLTTTQAQIVLVAALLRHRHAAIPADCPWIL